MLVMGSLDPLPPLEPASAPEKATQDEGSTAEETLAEATDRKKRHRRTHSELDRSIVCPFPDCGRCYASKHALHLHMKNKHGWVGKKGQAAAAAVMAAGSVEDLNGIRSLFKSPADAAAGTQPGTPTNVPAQSMSHRRHSFHAFERPVEIGDLTSSSLVDVSSSGQANGVDLPHGQAALPRIPGPLIANRNGSIPQLVNFTKEADFAGSPFGSPYGTPPYELQSPPDVAPNTRRASMGEMYSRSSQLSQSSTSFSALECDDLDQNAAKSALDLLASLDVDELSRLVDDISKPVSRNVATATGESKRTPRNCPNQAPPSLVPHMAPAHPTRYTPLARLKEEETKSLRRNHSLPDLSELTFAGGRLFSELLDDIGHGADIFGNSGVNGDEMTDTVSTGDMGANRPAFASPGDIFSPQLHRQRIPASIAVSTAPSAQPHPLSLDPRSPARRPRSQTVNQLQTMTAPLSPKMGSPTTRKGGRAKSVSGPTASVAARQFVAVRHSSPLVRGPIIGSEHDIAYESPLSTVDVSLDVAFAEATSPPLSVGPAIPNDPQNFMHWLSM